jgi:hypothetical protein
MNAREAVRLKFTHIDSEKPPTTESVTWCHANRHDGSRCKQPWKKHAYGFRFCRNHWDDVNRWVAKTSLDGREPQP